MADNFELVTLTSIEVKPNRQRKAVDKIAELASSIETIGLLNPIIVAKTDTGTIQLVAGERRLRAYELLALQQPEETKFTTIPVRFFNNLSQAELQLIELEENLKREDLTWQETVEAVLTTIEAFQKHFPDWTQAKIAEAIGYDYSTVVRYAKVARALRADHPQVKAASGIRAAISVLERENERKITASVDKLVDDIDRGLDIAEAKETLPKYKEETGKSALAFQAGTPESSAFQGKDGYVKPATAAIINNDFISWAESYKGEKFNFIHCDFPYGIDHQDSDQGGSKVYGAYEDSEDIYWKLCEAFCTHRDKFMLNSCHVVFWFSMKFYEETKAFFAKHAPELEIQDFPLIWHKSDNKGIVPDVTRQPRRVYETALLMARGDRKIIKPLANCYSAPTNKADAIHVSEKPMPVLRHFFSMLVDEHTRVLDPTCGGGTSIRTAEELGAENALGIELDPVYAEAAVKKLHQARTLLKLSEDGK